MAFWDREEKTEWEKYQRTKKRRGEAEAGEKPTVAEEFKSYFKTVRQAQAPEGGEPESGEPEQPGEQASPIQTFLSRFRSEEKKEEPEGPPEKCPWCGGDMEKGYLTGGQGVSWTKKKPGFFTGTLFSGEEPLVLSNEGGIMDNLYKTAWHCPACKKLTVDMTGVGEIPEAVRKTMSPAPPEDEGAGQDAPDRTREDQEET